ncbi:unnamed protein product [Vitrella brassicaformis CCMP3155]|uniref:Uncharacterized protein n=1 Tax=Vitrella brassicaformis (strain CCMP3155) TaxID=1169540 RepID=A0A0G4EUG4_VITBC|nr:unnamed protein product [Vitrella brassicaformis CCMP3155]|eukprot:CEM01933.1 unnamed protein product [Vitrella brassicaformis CCMP3155]
MLSALPAWKMRVCLHSLPMCRRPTNGQASADSVVRLHRVAEVRVFSSRARDVWRKSDEVCEVPAACKTSTLTTTPPATPSSAIPVNAILPPPKARRLNLEQPGCVHTNTDLFKGFQWRAIHPQRHSLGGPQHRHRLASAGTCAA